MQVKTATLIAVFRSGSMAGGVNIRTERFKFSGFDPISPARKAKEEIEGAFYDGQGGITVKCVIIEGERP